MIDIHCHLLPGIDDGPADAKAALALAQALVSDGITQVVMTPHVFPGRFENRRSSIVDEQQAFLALMQETGLKLDILWAGEVRLTPEVLDLLVIDELPFLGRTGNLRNLLLEMPDGQVPLGALNFVRHLLAARIRPVIAHPERNRGVMDKIDRLEPLLDAGCVAQVTAGSLVGQFGVRAQEVAIELLQRGWVEAIASDAHNLTGRRPRMVDAAAWLTQHFGAAKAHQLTVLGPASLCADNASVNTVQSVGVAPASALRSRQRGANEA